MFFSLTPKKDDLVMDKTGMTDDHGKVDVPNFSLAQKPIVPVVSPMKGLGAERPHVITLKTRVLNYLLSDCNGNGKIIDRSNINLVVDPDAKEVIIGATENGRFCLNAVNRQHINHIVREETGEDYRIQYDQ